MDKVVLENRAAILSAAGKRKTELLVFKFSEPGPPEPYVIPTLCGGHYMI